MMILAAILISVSVFTRPMDRVSTMDPVMSRSLYDSQAIQLVYEPILKVDYEARPYRLVPGFCELPEVSEDGLIYTFRLTQKNQQGSLSARDVVRGLERVRNPAQVSPNAWIMRDVDEVVALDETTVKMTLKRPVPYFMWLMSMTATGVMGENGEGSGTFRLKSWRRNHEMVFERRQPKPGYFDMVRYLVVDDPSTRWLMFMKGEIDMLGEVPRDNWDAIDANDPRLYSTPTLEVMYLGINMRDPVLGGNKKLRQALNAAFDFPAWSDFYNGRVLECNGPVPHRVEGRIDEPFEYRFDLAKAKQLIAEAGYPNGIDPVTGRRLTITLSIGRANQESREAGELIVAFFDRIGVKLELQFMLWDAFLKAINDGRVQLYRMGWVGDYPDAQNFLQLFYSPNASPGVNHSNYSNAEYDAAYESGDYRRCQEIVREDCPWIFTHFNMSHTMVNDSVSNYIPSDFAQGNEQYYRFKKESK